MRMIFEIRDLKYATPATVSRAGILYISTDDGTQWVSLIQSWLKKREEPQDIKDAFQVDPPISLLDGAWPTQTNLTGSSASEFAPRARWKNGGPCKG